MVCCLKSPPASLFLAGASLLLAQTSCMPSQQTAQQTITIDASRAEHLGVTLSLPREQSNVVLKFQSSGIREKAWQLVNPVDTRIGQETHLTFQSGADSVQWQITSDPDFVDRVYPSAFIAEQGSVLNLDYFITDPAPDTLHVSVTPPAEFAMAGCETTQAQVIDLTRPDRAMGRYVLLSADPALCRRDTGMAYLGDVPGWIELAVSGVLDRTLNSYANIFNQQAADAPFIVTYADLDPSKVSRWRGDVGTDGFVFLRFFGPAWRDYDAVAEDSIEAFVAHELVHLWLGQGYVQTREEARVWFFEGAAEYLSLSALLNASGPLDDTLTEIAETRANACFEALNGQSLDEAASRKGRLAYDCGFVFHWLVDVHDYHLGRVGQNRWAKTLQRSNNREISYTDYLQAIAGTELSFVTSDGANIQGALLSDLAMFGIEASLETAADNDTRLAHVLRHLLSQVCENGAIGFSTFVQYIQLDTGARCAGLSGDPNISSLSGRSLFNLDDAALMDLFQACEKGDPIRFETQAGKLVSTVSCREPFPDLAKEIVINGPS